MFILLTDALTCPRCGPEFGLVVLADRLEARRVVEGRLGCPNCREAYRVRDGQVDFRPPAAPPPDADADAAPPRAAPPDETEAAVRTAALLGLADVSGLVLLAGAAALRAAAVSALVPEVEVVAFSPDPGPAAAGVSRVAGGWPPPFRTGTLRGVAVASPPADRLREALRVLAPGHRLLVEAAPPGTAEALREMGATVLLDEGGTVVARGPGPVVQLQRNAVR